MLKPSFVKVVVAGVLLAAGSVQAASPFPSAKEEVPAAWYAHTIQTAPVGAESGSRVPFPSAAREHGSSHETYVDVRRSRIGANIMGATGATFPSLVNETSPLNL